MSHFNQDSGVPATEGICNEEKGDEYWRRRFSFWFLRAQARTL